MIQYALTEAQLAPTKEAIIMVGDRNHDILGAQQNGLDSIGACMDLVKKQNYKRRSDIPSTIA